LSDLPITTNNKCLPEIICDENIWTIANKFQKNCQKLKLIQINPKLEWPNFLFPKSELCPSCQQNYQTKKEAKIKNNTLIFTIEFNQMDLKCLYPQYLHNFLLELAFKKQQIIYYHREEGNSVRRILSCYFFINQEIENKGAVFLIRLLNSFFQNVFSVSL